MKIKRISVTTVLALALGLSVGCGKKDSDDDEEEAGTKLTKVESVDELNVSGSLNISLPDSFDKSATALSLLATRRSHEACRMGQTLKEVTSKLSEVGGFFCHIEAESKNIKFGVKYKITTNGEEFGDVWVDNSKADSGAITLYMCKDGKIKDKIDITGVDIDRKAAKGSLNSRGSEGDQSWATAVTFDVNFTDENLVTITSQDKYSDDASGGSFARQVSMNLFAKGKGVSKLSLSSKGTWGGSAFTDKAFARHNGDYGHAIVAGSGTQADNVFDYTHNAFFDGDGLAVSDDATDAFASGGELDVTAEELPAYLKSDFEPDAPDGWKCDTDETIDLDPESKAHKACETDHSNDQANCWGEDFEQGEDVE